MAIKKLNTTMVDEQHNTLTVDYVEFNELRGCDMRVMLDIDLKWARDYVASEFNTVLEQWFDMVTIDQLVAFMTKLDEATDSVLYGMSWPIREE